MSSRNVAPARYRFAVAITTEADLLLCIVLYIIPHTTSECQFGPEDSGETKIAVTRKKQQNDLLRPLCCFLVILLLPFSAPFLDLSATKLLGAIH